MFLTSRFRPEPVALTKSVRWLLCLSVGLTVLAHAVKTFRGDGTALNAFLFLDWGWPDERLAQTERVWLMAIAGLTGLGVALAGIWRSVAWWMIPAGLYLLLEAVLSVHVGGQPFSHWSPAAAALRYGTPLFAPLVLAGCLQGAESSTRSETLAGWRAGSFGTGALLLRFAVAVVFFTHGCEAWQHHPRFIDLVIGTGARQFDVWLDETLVTRILTGIGVVDVVVAIAILLSWNPLFLGWAAFWGLVTASSRMTAFGWGAYPDVLLRATHFLVPLALLLLIRPPWMTSSGNSRDRRQSSRSHQDERSPVTV